MKKLQKNILSFLLILSIGFCSNLFMLLTQADIIPPVKILNPMQGSTVRVMSFNIKFNGDGDNTPQNRFDRVVKYLNNNKPDSIGLQEVESPFWIQKLSEGLSDYAYIGGGQTPFDNPIFYLKSKYSVVDSGVFWLSPDGVPNTKYQDASWYRVCSWAVLRNNKTGETYAHVNTHLDDQSSTARTEGAKMVFDKINSFDMPVVCTGDFNCTESSAPYATMTSGKMKDSRYIATQTPLYTGGTYHNFGNENSPLPIDFCFVSESYFTVQQYTVLREKIQDQIGGRSGYYYPSDHYGVLIEAKLQTTPKVLMGDVNGDGLSDMVISRSKSGKRSLSVYKASSDGTYLPPITLESAYDYSADASGKDTGHLTDVNGDGKSDYVVVWKNGNTRSFLTYLAKADGSYSDIQPNVISYSSGHNITLDTSGRDTGTFTDVNGDGRSDYVVVWKNGNTRSFLTYLAKADGSYSDIQPNVITYSSGHNITLDTNRRDTGTFTDVNGDGRSDYVVVWKNGKTRSFLTYLAKANGGYSDIQPNAISYSSGHNITLDTSGRDTGTFTDVNGDGRSDYVVVWKNGKTRSFLTYLAKTDGNYSDIQPNAISYSSAHNITLDTSGRDTGTFTDINCDGRSDYVVVWNNNGNRSFLIYNNINNNFNDNAIKAYNSAHTYVKNSEGKDNGVFVFTNTINGRNKIGYVMSWNYNGKRTILSYTINSNNMFNEGVNSWNTSTQPFYNYF